MKSGQISEDVIQRKADSIRAMLKEKDAPPSQEEMSSLATFIHHKYITRVLDIELRNINLSDVAHVSSLTDVTNEQTKERYGDQLLTWGDSMGWEEHEFRGGVYIQRK